MYSSTDSVQSFLRQLPDEVQAYILAHQTRRQVKRGEVLVQAGEICRTLYIVEKGMFRTYRRETFGEEEREITSGFSFPGDFETSPASLFMEQPSKESIEALADSEVVAFHFSQITELRRTSFAFNELIIYALADYMIATEDILYEIRVYPASVRYANLLKDHPDFIRQIPLKYLASYLGISVETMSRIRAKS
ncbi:MAG: Crp/Fnr family transcriptional regulator [Bacteroidia bacterium]|nr:Crp/Fnr family transcriptional regulator [Bacteroidia bacterium]